MSRSRRVLVVFGAFALFLFGLPTSSSATDPASNTTAASAVAWLKTQQQADGGFEVVGFPGFETRDAALAIAEQAQTGASWSSSQAFTALAALHQGGSGPTPLDALDAYAPTITTAGEAAKTIVLSTFAFGLDPNAFDPAGNGGPVDLVAKLDAGCSANTPSFGVAFNDTLYAVIAKRMVCGSAPAAAVATVRAAQQTNGGWNFLGDPTRTDIDDIDTTALALEALVAAGTSANDSAVRAALAFLADRQQASGAWQSFGSDDPNSTAVALIAITAAGYDVTSPCWRNTAVPAKTPTPYANPDAWLRSQQVTSGVDTGRIASPNDAFFDSTFATSQAVEGLLRSWLPIAPASPQDCAVPPPVVSTATPTAGQSIILSGDGYAPNTPITVELHSDPVVLGTTMTDTNGHYSLTITIPEGTPPGPHEIVVTGMGTDGQMHTSSITITVQASAPAVTVPPPFTG